MSRKLALVGAILIAGWLLVPSAVSAEEETTEKTAHGFVGVDGCKLCHKSEKKGDQYGKWSAESHAKAFATLGTEEAAKVVAEKGLKGSAQELDECLSCHVTAHGVAAELIGPKYTKEEGVGCESCHGAGNDYKAKKVMESREESIANGMIIPTEETCRGCHNEKSPTFKGFDYEKALAQIAHPNPAKGAPAEE